MFWLFCFFNRLVQTAAIGRLIIKPAKMFCIIKMNDHSIGVSIVICVIVCVTSAFDSPFCSYMGISSFMLSVSVWADAPWSRKLK